MSVLCGRLGAGADTERAGARNRYEDRTPPGNQLRYSEGLEVKTVLRHPPAFVVVLLVLASACSSGDGTDTTPTGSPAAVEVEEGESPLEGEWYDSNGNVIDSNVTASTA